MKMTANLGVARCTEGVIIHVVTGQFDNCGFPQAIGCIDGTYVPVKHPCENENTAFSTKCSTQLLARQDVAHLVILQM